MSCNVHRPRILPGTNVIKNLADFSENKVNINQPAILFTVEHTFFSALHIQKQAVYYVTKHQKRTKFLDQSETIVESLPKAIEGVKDAIKRCELAKKDKLAADLKKIVDEYSQKFFSQSDQQSDSRVEDKASSQGVKRAAKVIVSRLKRINSEISTSSSEIVTGSKSFRSNREFWDKFHGGAKAKKEEQSLSGLLSLEGSRVVPLCEKTQNVKDKEVLTSLKPHEEVSFNIDPEALRVITAVINKMHGMGNEGDVQAEPLIKSFTKDRVTKAKTLTEQLAAVFQRPVPSLRHVYENFEDRLKANKEKRKAEGVKNSFNTILLIRCEEKKPVPHSFKDEEDDVDDWEIIDREYERDIAISQAVRQPVLTRSISVYSGLRDLSLKSEKVYCVTDSLLIDRLKSIRSKIKDSSSDEE